MTGPDFKQDGRTAWRAQGRRKANNICRDPSHQPLLILTLSRLFSSSTFSVDFRNISDHLAISGPILYIAQTHNHEARGPPLSQTKRFDETNSRQKSVCANIDSPGGTNLVAFFGHGRGTSHPSIVFFSFALFALWFWGVELLLTFRLKPSLRIAAKKSREVRASSCGSQ